MPLRTHAASWLDVLPDELVLTILAFPWLMDTYPAIAEAYPRIAALIETKKRALFRMMAPSRANLVRISYGLLEADDILFQCPLGWPALAARVVRADRPTFPHSASWSAVVAQVKQHLRSRLIQHFVPIEEAHWFWPGHESIYGLGFASSGFLGIQNDIVVVAYRFEHSSICAASKAAVYLSDSVFEFLSNTHEFVEQLFDLDS